MLVVERFNAFTNRYLGILPIVALPPNDLK